MSMSMPHHYARSMPLLSAAHNIHYSSVPSFAMAVVNVLPLLT